MSGIIKKIVKLAAYLLLVTLLFIAAITTVFVATFDANDYKKDLQTLVLDKTGRDLQFFGDVALTVYPALGMKLGALSLSNAEGFGAEPMVKVNHVSISVDVASLLVMRPEVDRLVLRDLEINLSKNKAGQTNWADLMSTNKSSRESADGKKNATGSDSDKPEPVSVAFGGLDIENARLRWLDRQLGVEYRISDLDLNSGRISTDSAFPLKLHVALQSGDDLELDLNLDSSIQYKLEKNRIEIRSLKIDVTGKGESLPFSPLNLGLQSEQVNADLDTSSIQLQDLQLSLNDLEITGQINLRDYRKPSATFKLAADTLDIDQLLGTPTPGTQSPGPAAPSEATIREDVEIKLPMDLLRSLDIDGELNVNQLKMQNLTMQQLALNISAKAGLIDLKPIKLNLYEGSFDGAVQLDARSRLPRYRIFKNLQRVKAGQLLTDFTGEDKLSGTMNASINLSTSGERLSALKQNSEGDISLLFADGAIKGFNLRYLIEKARARLSGQPLPDETTQKTDFSSLGLSGKINRGVFISDDLDLQAPLLRVDGSGKANLNNETVDYLVNAKLVKTLKGQQGGATDDLDGLLIPVRINGPFSGPKIDVQLDEMLKARQASQIAAEKAKLQAEIDKQKAELKAARQREKEKQKAVLKAKKEAAKQKVKDKLKKLLE